MKLYFIRHGQTWVNADGNYSQDNKDSLSEVGSAQAHDLISRLAGYHFTKIYVSPAERTLHTILPYLQHTRQTAEVWAELIETCWQADHNAQPRVRIEPRVRFQVPLALIEFFYCPEAHSLMLPANETYQEGLAFIKIVRNALLAKHSRTQDEILVVGHGHSGGVLLSLLQGKPWDHAKLMDNTEMVCWEEPSE